VVTIPLERTAVVLLASGLSRRYGRRDKLLANLGGKPLIEHPARVVAGLHALSRVAVCPSDRHEIKDRLASRFVIALNKQPKHGLGHSIALGAQIALQFKPEAIIFCMGDMPFIEAWLFDALLTGLDDADIVHSGVAGRVHPPTAFGPVCFDELRELDGDDGAKRLIGQGAFRVTSISAPPPVLVDVDTREELAYAEKQLALREQYEDATRPVASARDQRGLPPVDPIPPLRAVSARSS
jgi:molybdenum cofactor cytidylyltransferase